MLNQDQIQGKWTEIKGGIRNLWGQLTDDELEQTKGNIGAVSGIVQQKYGEAKESIKQKLDTLMDSFDNETDKSLKLNDGESSYQRSPTGVRTSARSQFQDSDSDISTRSPERRTFEQSEGGAINTKQGIAGNQDNQSTPGRYRSGLSAGTGAVDAQDSTLHDLDFGKENQGGGEYDTEEIFDEGDKEPQTYEAKKSRGPSQAEDRIARH